MATTIIKSMELNARSQRFDLIILIDSVPVMAVFSPDQVDPLVLKQNVLDFANAYRKKITVVQDKSLVGIDLEKP